MPPQGSQRIDRLLVDLGLAETRSKARALIMAGEVLVEEKRVEKPSEMFLPGQRIRLKKDPQATKYVGRGGIKLEHALDRFHICPSTYVCLDIGSSTGGFTDCLLQNGASKVVAVDSGSNQLAWKIRNDDRVEVRENTNARYLEPDDFDDRFDVIVIDVSFISVTKILPALVPLLKDNGDLIVLVKPQFEAGRDQVGKGGIVKDSKVHKAVIDGVVGAAEACGLVAAGLTDSPILGASGNKEFFLHLKRN